MQSESEYWVTVRGRVLRGVLFRLNILSGTVEIKRGKRVEYVNLHRIYRAALREMLQSRTELTSQSDSDIII